MFVAKRSRAFGASDPTQIFATRAEYNPVPVAPSRVDAFLLPAVTAQLYKVATPTLGPLICQRPGYTWIEAAAGVPGHWERQRAGSTGEGLPGPADPVTGACGTSEIRVHTSGSVPGTTVTATNTLRTLHFQFVQVLSAFLQELNTINKQLTTLLPACSEELQLTKTPWVTNLNSRGPAGKMGWAYDQYHSPQAVAAWADAREMSGGISNPALWQRSMIPGTFGIFGVPFAFTERNEAVYQKTFTPSVNQRWLIEYQIVLASNSGDTIDDATRKLKVSDALIKLNQKGLHYTTNLPGFGLNPSPPMKTDTLGAYLASGGYLIDLDRTQGIQPAPLVGKSIGKIPNGRLACTTFCKDPSSGLPYCTETINLSGDADNVSSWDIYVNIGPTCTITAKYREYDPSWFGKAVSVVAGFMDKTLKAVCTPGTPTNSYATSATGAAASSTNPYMMVWGKTGGYVLAKCGVAFTPKTPITPVEAQLLTPQVSPQPLAPVSAIPPKYQGCLSRFHKSKRTFSVYCPLDWQPTGPGLGAADLFGQVVIPAPPAGTIKVANLPVAPSEAPNVGTEDDPLYAKWWFWTIVGSVAVAGSVGGVALVRRRRRTR